MGLAWGAEQKLSSIVLSRELFDDVSSSRFESQTDFRLR